MQSSLEDEHLLALDIVSRQMLSLRADTFVASCKKEASGMAIWKA